ncbi:MAG: ergothioneine biosynthesis protein EgtB [Bacteroidota bacterium]
MALITAPTPLATLAERYDQVRAFTRRLAAPLAIEDYVIQTMEDVSPTKWHLAHTTWFFETFVLSPHLEGYRPCHPQYAYLFNSYYIQAGERHCRDRRGYLSRPTVEEVYAYRTYVDEHMQVLLNHPDEALQAVIAPLVEIGLHHEQQHQELLVTDIKHVLSVNPLRPVYRADLTALGTPEEAPPLAWLSLAEGTYTVGHEGSGFHYDNEAPRHTRYLHEAQIASRLVTNAEYLAFMADGGYQRPELWLSAGWATVQERGWTEPFYWERHDDGWQLFTMGGLQPVPLHAPVCHLSYFEADAYARWAGMRLPTEGEWEVAMHLHGPAVSTAAEANMVEHDALQPVPLMAAPSGRLHQGYGDVWEWTRSQYDPYPGYAPAPGALGEYNGKFMCNQFVLRGGSCATSYTHIRPTYRNFFPPDSCWQFTGLRLARDV